MYIPLLAGALFSEGIYKYQESKDCPQFIKNHSESCVSQLKDTHCIKIACAVIIGTYVSSYALTISLKTLKGRLQIFQSPLKAASGVLGSYSHSIPFLVSAVCYFARRDTLYGLGRVLYQIYSKTEEISSCLVNAALDPNEAIERLSKELNEEIDGLKEAIKVILKDFPPEILQAIDNDLDLLVAHLENRNRIIPQYQEKLIKAQNLMEKKQTELSSYIETMKYEAKKLEQLFSEIESDDSGFFAEALKDLLGFQSLVEKKAEFDQKIHSLQTLSEKIALFVSGMGLLDVIDKQEITTFRQWNVMVKQAPLKRFEGILLFVCDLPWIARKEYMLKYHGRDTGCRDLNFWERKRRVVNELAPKGVIKFSKALASFKTARARVIAFLNAWSIDNAMDKRGWEIEHLFLQKGTVLLLESTEIFYKKLFPIHLVSQDICRIQSDIRKQKQKHIKQVNAMPKCDQALVKISNL